MAALLVATLAIGLSGTIVVFSLADLALWHPLPFRQPDRLVSLWSYLPRQHTTAPTIRLAALDGWAARERLFSAVYVYGTGGFTVSGHGEPSALTGARVSRGIFSGLGVHPALGREFDADDFVSGAGHVMVISDQLWQSRFGGDRDALGSWLDVDDVPYRVVGVMPPHFTFPVTNVLFWIPLISNGPTDDRFSAAALLAPGVTFQEASAAADATAVLYGADGVRLAAIRVRPFARRVPQTERLLWILGGAVTLVLLIAVANAANLFLADAVQRQAEVATRLAIGATTARIVRQLLTEASVIAVIAAAAAVLVSATVMDLIAVLLPHSVTFQTLKPIAVDWRGWVVAAAAATGATSIAALAPLFRIGNALENASRRSGVDGSTNLGVRSTLVTAQVAITFVVLIAAALLAQSFVNIQHADLGYDSRNLMAVSVALRGDAFKTNLAKQQFVEDVRAATANVPGVVAVTVSESIPPQLGFGSGPIETDDGRTAAEASAIAQASIDAEFFKTLGIPLLRGEVPRAALSDGSRRPAVVSRSFAEAVWPDRDPIGRAFRFAGMTPWFVVTAVAGDVQNGSFESPLGTLAVYQLRSAESNVWFYQSIVVRVASDRRHVETAIRDIVKRLNSHVAVAKVDPASAVIMDMNARLQFTTWVMVGFSALAGFLALIGVYGAFWYVVRRRTREIAVRIALGAEQRDVVWMILTACGRWALIGIAVGVPTAIVATRTLASLLYGTSPANPLTYSAVCVGLFGAAIAAAWWPARRASRLDPAAALRAE